MKLRAAVITAAVALGVLAPAAEAGPGKLASDSSLYSNHPSYGSGRAVPKGKDRWLVSVNDTMPGHGCVAVLISTGRRPINVAQDCRADGVPVTAWVTASSHSMFDLFLSEPGLSQAMLPAGQRPQR